MKEFIKKNEKKLFNLLYFIIIFVFSLMFFDDSTRGVEDIIIFLIVNSVFYTSLTLYDSFNNDFKLYKSQQFSKELSYIFTNKYILFFLLLVSLYFFTFDLYFALLIFIFFTFIEFTLLILIRKSLFKKTNNNQYFIIFNFFLITFLFFIKIIF